MDGRWEFRRKVELVNEAIVRSYQLAGLQVASLNRSDSSALRLRLSLRTCHYIIPLTGIITLIICLFERMISNFVWWKNNENNYTQKIIHIITQNNDSKIIHK